MKAIIFIAVLFFTPFFSFAQDSASSSQQAVYLTNFGSKTLFVLQYDQRIVQGVSLQAGVGLNDLDRTASTAFRLGISYLSGTEHMVELSLTADIWTKLFNPIASEDQFVTSFIGYRYQPQQGFTFRLGINPLQFQRQYLDSSEWFLHVLSGSIGYAF